MFSIRFISKTSTVTPPPQCFCFSNMSWLLSNYSKSLENLNVGRFWARTSLKSFRLENKVQRKRWKPESGIQPLLGRGIRNAHTWNPESTDTESGIHSVESRIQGSLGLPYRGRHTSELLCSKVNLRRFADGLRHSYYIYTCKSTKV